QIIVVYNIQMDAVRSGFGKMVVSNFAAPFAAIAKPPFVANDPAVGIIAGGSVKGKGCIDVAVQRGDVESCNRRMSFNTQIAIGNVLQSIIVFNGELYRK